MLVARNEAFRHAGPGRIPTTMDRINAFTIALLVVTACSAPNATPSARSPAAAPPPMHSGPAPVRALPQLTSTGPQMIDQGTLEWMIQGPTDWASFVSPKRGVTMWKGDQIDRICDARGATELAALVATMHGARCETSTIEALCETSHPTHVVQFVHEDGHWYGYGITYDEPDDLTATEQDLFSDAPRASCKPLHHDIDWCDHRGKRDRRCKVPQPAPPPEPTAAQFDAAPSILAAPTRGCTVKYVAGFLQVSCPLAVHGTGLLDANIVDVGRLDVTRDTATWTVERDAMQLAWTFDSGVDELPTSPTKAAWNEVAPFPPDARALMRDAAACCISKHGASECVGHGVGYAATQCKAARSSCGAFDACMQREIADLAVKRHRH